MSQSIVETNILSKDFEYLPPFFYNNTFALRCELGNGDTNEEYMLCAQRRAMEIFRLLFPAGADALFFDYWLYDDCSSGIPEAGNDSTGNIEQIHNAYIEDRIASMRFLFRFQDQYRHIVVRDLPGIDDDDDNAVLGRNRVVCYADGKAFDADSIISNQLVRQTNPLVSFVSFEKELIFSVYDDRGCDIVFSTHEAMAAFYDKLEPYFLDYDRDEMVRRMSKE